MDSSLTHGTVIRLAWPVVVSLLSLTAMGLVDALFVGRLGTTELAAVGLSVPMVFLIYAFPFGIFLASKVAVAQLFGAGNARGVHQAAWLSFVLALALGFFGLSTDFWVVPLLRATGADERVAFLARDYVLIRAHGAPLVFAFQVMQGVFQGQGNTRITMVAVLLANAVTVSLEGFLVFGFGPVPEMGIAGAALANVFGQAAGALALVGPFVRRHPLARWTAADVRFLVELGFPLGIQRLVEVASFVVFSVVVARLGSIEMAAHLLVIRIIGLSFLPGQAVAQAAEVLVGQAVGARDPGRARRAFVLSLQIAVAVEGACGLLFVGAPGLLLAPFRIEAGVFHTAVELLAICAVFQILDATAEVAEGTLAGLGQTRWVLLMGIVECWLVRLPLSIFLAFSLGMGVRGVYWGLAIGICLRGLAGAWRIWWREERLVVHAPLAPAST